MVLNDLLKVIPTESEIIVEEYNSRDRRSMVYATYVRRFGDRAPLARVRDCEILSVHSSKLYSGRNDEALTVEILV